MAQGKDRSRLIHGIGVVLAVAGIGVAAQSTGQAPEPPRLAGQVALDLRDVKSGGLLGDMQAGMQGEGARDVDLSRFPEFAPPPAPSRDATGTPCAATLTARDAGTAAVLLDIDAPCLPAARFVLHHAGLMVSAMTDAAGQAGLRVPALTENAVFFVAFDAGETLAVQHSVADLGAYRRVVLQWRGDAALVLEARRAPAGGARPEHADRPPSDRRTDSAQPPSLPALLLGSGPAPLRAAILTFPARPGPGSDTVDLRITASATPETCGTQVAGHMIDLHAPGDLRVRDLSLAMPACPATGDALVLKNLPRDRTLATQ